MGTVGTCGPIPLPVLRPCSCSCTNKFSSPLPPTFSKCVALTDNPATLTRPQLAPFKQVSARMRTSTGCPHTDPSAGPFTQPPQTAYCQNWAFSAHAYAGKARCLLPPATSCDLASHAHIPPPLPLPHSSRPPCLTPPTPLLLRPSLTAVLPHAPRAVPNN